MPTPSKKRKAEDSSTSLEATVEKLQTKTAALEAALGSLRGMQKATRGQSLLTDTKLKVPAPLDAGFAPYIIGKRAYLQACEAASKSSLNYVRELKVAILRQNGLCNRLEIPVFPSSDSRYNDSLLFCYFTIMFAIVQKGGFKVMLSGPSEVCEVLQKEFSLEGHANFPVDLMTQVYDRPFEVVRVARNQLPVEQEDPEAVGLDVAGCRLAFDLGKSDFKVVACIDGEVKYHTETEWDIYQTNPEYHYNIVLEEMKKAAATMPRVDSVGGASAGVPIKNDCVWNDCFPRVSREDYKRVCVPFFKNLAKEFGDVPLKVMNDGEVTAVAGVQMLEKREQGCTIGKGTFGISMGSNCGAGYMLPTGDDGVPRHSGWLNELWTAPADFSPDSWECFFTAQDMVGMSSMCFGQQAACKLLTAAGLQTEACIKKFPNLASDKLPQHQLLGLQSVMKEGSTKEKAAGTKIYETIGVYLGYATAQYSEFYDFNYFLILGRVTKGSGGDVILDKAKEVLKKEFPELDVEFVIPDEHMKGIGQCVAAAAMPEVKK